MFLLLLIALEYAMRVKLLSAFNHVLIGVADIIILVIIVCVSIIRRRFLREQYKEFIRECLYDED